MDIYTSDELEQKSYFVSLMRRYGAIAAHFGSLTCLGIGEEPLASYVRDVAELVEVTRVAQLVLENLVRLGNCDIGISQEFGPFSMNVYSLDFGETNVDDARGEFLSTICQCGECASDLATSFETNIQPGVVRDEPVDLSRHYSSYGREVTFLLDMTLQAQGILAQILRFANYKRYLRGSRPSGG